MAREPDLELIQKALQEHGHKLSGLECDKAIQIAVDGRRLVIVTNDAGKMEGCELVLDLTGLQIWGCRADVPRLLDWLNDERVVAICVDDLNDVRLLPEGPDQPPACDEREPEGR